MEAEKTTLNTKITSLIEKFRFVIIGALIALILAAVVVAIVFSISTGNVESGLSKLDALEFRYESLDSASDTLELDQGSIVAEVDVLADSSSGIVRVRSLLFSADVKFEDENWSDARDAYLGAYEEDMNSYTAPLALYNAAVASEELSEMDSAVEYFTLAADYENFSLAARALFNAGRIEDSRENFLLASDMYTKVNDLYPNTTWSNLAKSRLIVLKSENKVE